MNDYLNSLKWRYAVKKYDAAKKVSAEELEQLKEAVRLSVSSVGLQPYKVIIVETDEAKQQLAEAMSGNNKNLVMGASHVFIFANELNVNENHVDRYMDNISVQRQLAKEAISGFGDYIKAYVAGLTEDQRNTWTAKQAYIALSSLVNAASLLKIDTTPMEGYDADKANQILGLTDKGLNVAVMAAVGYRHDDDANQHLAKVRKPNEELFITI